MAWTNYQYFLAFLMVITGSINSLAAKWADDLKSVGRDGGLRIFDHPFFQATCMFLGEFLCLIVFKILYFVYKRRGDGSEDVEPLTKGNRNFNPLILYLPAMCDMTGTSVMYVGLTLTYVSSFQMLRGFVIVFVGLLSVGFLSRVLTGKQWLGISFIIVGLGIVGAADMTSKSSSGHSHNDLITGDLLIVVAQIIVSIQMVVEEKFVSGLDIPPLQAVGWEGLFGLVTLSIVQIPLYYIRPGPPFSNSPNGALEDVIDAFVQIANNWRLVVALAGTVVSIAFFNFAGISVTKEISATTRMVLDSIRTLIIWIFSLTLLGQSFNYLQLIGFIGLIIGMCIYNGITVKDVYVKATYPFKRLRYGRVEEEQIEHHPADIPNDDRP